MSLTLKLESIISTLTNAKSQLLNFETKHVKTSATRVRVDLMKAKKEIDGLRKAILIDVKSLTPVSTKVKEEEDDEELPTPPPPPKLVRQKAVSKPSKKKVKTEN